MTYYYSASWIDPVSLSVYIYYDAMGVREENWSLTIGSLLTMLVKNIFNLKYMV